MLFDSPDLVPSGVRERIMAPLLRNGVRITLKSALSPRLGIDRQRWWARQMSRLARPNRRVVIAPATVGGVAGEWLRPHYPAGVALRNATILYLHGGAYCIGAAATHRAITSRFARAARMTLFAADYRLAPEHPFPAAVEDAVAAYRALAAGGRVMIAGESAGGGLAIATALALRDRQITPPAALVVFSPWVDLTPAATAEVAPSDEVMLTTPWLDDCARRYLAGADPASPLASPLHGDLRGLAPTLIQAGADELLCAQAVRLHDALANAGVAVRCEIVPGRWHAFQLHAGMLPSANAAIERAAGFVAGLVS
jgi:acetyl esterase/lipase